MNQKQVMLLATALHHQAVAMGHLVQLQHATAKEGDPGRAAMVHISRLREAAGDLKMITQSFIDAGAE